MWGRNHIENVEQYKTLGDFFYIIYYNPAEEVSFNVFECEIMWEKNSKEKPIFFLVVVVARI